MIKFLIVDDEQMEREGMKAILKREFPSLLMEEANNGQLAIELAADFYCPVWHSAMRYLDRGHSRRCRHR